MFGREDLAPYLRLRGRHDIRIYESIPSTNSTAKEMAKSGAAFGTVIIAAEQTGGRGRLGRPFYSPRTGSLYISVILAPPKDLASIKLITPAAAVAVCRAIDAVSGASCGIKWVNDIFSGDKKICGILTEAVTDAASGKIASVVLGIGVNINVPPEAFPEDIRDIAGSLALSERERVCFAAEIVNQIFEVYGADFEKRRFLAEYRRRCFTLGEVVFVVRDGGKTPALAVAVDEDGGLKVRYKDGKEETLISGEVSIRKQ